MQNNKMKKIYLIILVAIIIFLIIGIFFIVQRKKAQTDKEKISIQKEEVEDNESLENFTVNYINKIKSTGEVIENEYDEYIDKVKKINSNYNVELESQILDEKSTKSGLKYYTLANSQIEYTLRERGKYTLKEGDMINIVITNSENNEKVFDYGGIIVVANTQKNQS